MNGGNMRKVKVKLVRNTTDRDTMRPHYDFSNGVRGFAAARRARNNRVWLEVLLDKDVASAFPNSLAVNKALRSLMRPKRPRKKSLS